MREARPVRTWTRHAWIGLAALVCSLLLHGALLKWAPSLAIGFIAHVGMTPRYKPVVMNKAERKPVVRPPREASAVQRSPLVATVHSALMSESVFVPAKRQAKVSEPESASPIESARSELSANALRYEEIVRIQEALYDERVSALPRRFDERVPRDRNTPDIKLPILLPENPLQERVVHVAVAAVKSPVASAEPLADTLERRESSVGEAVVLDAEFGIPEDRVSPAAKNLERFLTLDVRTFRSAEEDALYFEMKVRPVRDDILPVLPRDILFVQDVSESMTQGKVEACREGWVRWLTSLSADDRFDILEFRDDVRACFGRWTEVNALSLARARAFIGEMASRGDTDLLRSLETIFRWPVSDRRPVLIILASDGRPTAGVVDSSTIITRFTERNAGARSMFCLSGGSRVNRFLMDLLSFSNRGDHRTCAAMKEIPVVMQQVSMELRRPVLAGLRFRATGTVSTNLYPAEPAHLYLDRSLVLYGKSETSSPSFAIQIVGWSADGMCDMMFPIDLSQSAEGTATIREGWARQRIYALLQEFVRSRSPFLLQELQDVAARCGIVLPYALGAP